MGCTLLQSLTLECELSSLRKRRVVLLNPVDVLFSLECTLGSCVGPKNCSWQDSWGFLIFPAFYGGIFHRNVVLGRNSCGTGIPVFTLDFNWTERQYFVIFREGVEMNYFLPYFIDRTCDVLPKTSNIHSRRLVLLHGGGPMTMASDESTRQMTGRHSSKIN